MGHPENKTFSHSYIVEFELNDEKRSVNMQYTVHHSDHTHNKFLPDDYRAKLIEQKTINPYYYTIYTLGHWGNKQLGGLFYKKFDVGHNTSKNKYNSRLPLHISFDFNVNPYVSCSIWQIEGGAIYNIDEIAAKSPENDAYSCSHIFMNRYNDHKSGLFIYGDPSGMSEDTRSEKGHNDYAVIERVLEKYSPELRVAKLHPPVAMRGNFINAIFEQNFDNLSIYINEESVYLKNDLLFGKQHPDGSKLKETGKVDGISGVQKYHHFSDNMDYFICEAFSESFEAYQHGDMKHYGRNKPSYGYKSYREDRRL